jgi:cobalt-zinc-cadmium efflux system protein
MAILSDAVHDLGDTAAIGFALFLEHAASKRRDHSFSYGYRRLSPLGGFITTAILLIGSIVILIESIPRIIHPEPVEAKGMILFAIIGVLVNGIAAWKLKNDSHAINSRAVMLHLLEDVLGWVAVLIGALTIYWFNWYFLDGYLSIAIALFIGFNAIKNGKQLGLIFLQGIPSTIDIDTIQHKLESLPKVSNVHDLHIWTLDGEQHVLSVHLVTSLTECNEITELKHSAKHLLEHEGISHVTIEIEHTNVVCDLLDC